MKRFAQITTVFLLSVFFLPVFAQEAPEIKVSTANDIQLTIISPENNSQIFGSDIEVSFIVNKFIFTDFTKRPNPFTGEGHMHVWLDQDNPGAENAQEVTKAADFTIHEVPAGNHTLIFELVDNDHNPLKKNIREVVTFESLEKQTEVTATIAAPSEPDVEKKQRLLELTSVSSIMITGFVVFLVIAVFGFIVYWIKNQ